VKASFSCTRYKSLPLTPNPIIPPKPSEPKPNHTRRQVFGTPADRQPPPLPLQHQQRRLLIRLHVLDLSQVVLLRHLPTNRLLRSGSRPAHLARLLRLILVLLVAFPVFLFLVVLVFARRGRDVVFARRGRDVVFARRGRDVVFVLFGVFVVADFVWGRGLFAVGRRGRLAFFGGGRGCWGLLIVRVESDGRMRERGEG